VLSSVRLSGELASAYPVKRFTSVVYGDLWRGVRTVVDKCVDEVCGRAVSGDG